MALTSLPKSAAASVANKTVSVTCPNTNTVYYTVPNGVSFHGDIVPSNSRYTWAIINGVQINLDRGADNKQFFYSLTLNSGDTVGTAGSYSGWQIVGNEIAL